MIRLLRRDSWVVGLFALFVALMILTKIIQPNYGARFGNQAFSGVWGR